MPIVISLAALLVAAINGTVPNLSDMPAEKSSEANAALTEMTQHKAQLGQGLDVVEMAARLNDNLPRAEHIGLGCARVRSNDGQPDVGNDRLAYAEAKLRGVSAIVGRRPSDDIERSVGGVERLQIRSIGVGGGVASRDDSLVERTVMARSLGPVGVIAIVDRLAITFSGQRIACVLVEER